MPTGPTHLRLTGKTVYVVDANSLIYQVFQALPEMIGPRGRPVGAVYGFTRDLFFLLKKKRPDYLFAVFDMSDRTVGRWTEVPEHLVAQFESTRQVTEALGVPALSCQSLGAGDILATVARAAHEFDSQCYLVTNDRRCRQLITDRVRLYNIRSDEVFDRDALKAEWGITPEQVVDYLALVGDSATAVPGVPLIGPKSTRKLLERYWTLDEVLDHADEISGAKRKASLIENSGQALLSRNLARFDPHAPIQIEWDLGRVGRIDRNRLLGLFREFGFRSLAKKVDALVGEPPASKQRVQPKHQIVTCLCGARLRVREDKLGKRGVCPKCRGQVHLIPTESPDADFETVHIRATKISKRGKARWRLSDGFEGFVEEVALHSYQSRGWRGLWGELDVWGTLMSLLFWDVIFARLEGVWYPEADFPSKRQDMPRDLHSAEFYHRRRGMIAARLEQLRSADVRDEVTQSYSCNYGRRCRPIWNWDRFSLNELTDAARALPRPALLAILDHLMREFGDNRVGVPDLFLWKGEGSAFAEVKGPTDRLSDQQKRWLSFLRNLGLRTFLVNVESG